MLLAFLEKTDTVGFEDRARGDVVRSNFSPLWRVVWLDNPQNHLSKGVREDALWLLNWRFNLGFLSLTFGIALFVGWRFSRKVGFIVAAVLLANIWFWLWTFIGRLIIDEFIY